MRIPDSLKEVSQTIMAKKINCNCKHIVNVIIRSLVNKQQFSHQMIERGWRIN